MAQAWGRITLIVLQLSDTYKCYYSNIIITQKVNRTPVLSNDFLTVKETVKENVPVVTDSGIHKLRLLLKFSCNWCTVHEHNFT